MRFVLGSIIAGIVGLSALHAISIPTTDDEVVSGLCLSGYVYVEAGGHQIGVPSSQCILPTGCDAKVLIGPKRTTVGPVTEEHGFLVPIPQSAAEIACYAA